MLYVNITGQPAKLVVRHPPMGGEDVYAAGPGETVEAPEGWSEAMRRAGFIPASEWDQPSRPSRLPIPAPPVSEPDLPAMPAISMPEVSVGVEVEVAGEDPDRFAKDLADAMKKGKKGKK